MKKLKVYFHFLFIMIFLLIGKECSAQSVFQKNYSGTCNIGYSIVTDNSGFVIAGTTSSSGQGGKDILIMKTDPDGNLLWAKTIGGPKDEIAYAIKQTSDLGYIIVGSTSSYVYAPSDSSNFYIIKTDISGNIQWTRSIGSFNREVAHDVIETYDNKYAVLGYTKSIGPGNEDVYFIELNSAGTLLWAYGMGGSGKDFGNSLIQTSSHEFIIVGSTTGFNAAGQVPYLIKTSEAGILQNSYTFGFSTYAVTNKRYFTKIIDGYYNDYAITGSDGLGSVGDAQYFILDIGQSFILNWMKKYTLNSGEGVGNSIVKAKGGFIIGGTMGIDHPAMIKTDDIGQLQATKFYPDLSSSYHGKGFDLKTTSDGEIILVGLRYNASDTSVYLIKTDGNTLSSGCDEHDGFMSSGTTMSTTVDAQTSTYASGTNFVAIDSGVVASAFPFVNTICETIGINQQVLQNKPLKIQQSNTTIDFLLEDDHNFIKSIDIYDVLGARVKSLGPKNQSISTLDLSKGIYFYQVLTSDQISYTGKFIVK